MVSLALLALVTLVASVVQGTAGFGFTLLAVSFFLLIIGSADAIPLLIIVNLAISLSLLRTLWRHVERALLSRLVIGSVLGFPLGLGAFQMADVNQLKIGAAGTILIFVAAAVIFRPAESSASDPQPRFRTASAVGVGSLAGAMTTALGMPGPVLMLYLAAVGSGKDAVRAMSLTFFVVAYGASLVLQATTVGLNRWVWVTAGLLVPVAVIGALLGHQLAKRVSERAFRAVVLVLIAATGTYVLFDALLS